MRLRFRSLRLQLPLLLLAFCGVLGFLLYVFVSRAQEARFEQEFADRHLLHATEIQSRTERAAERNELETAQRDFGEQGVYQEVRAAIFVSPQARVLLASRREWIGRPVDLGAMGIEPVDRPNIESALHKAGTSRRAQTVFSTGRNELFVILPAMLPVTPGVLRLDRRAAIIIVYDLALAKALNQYQLQSQFALMAGVILIAAAGLGLGLHFIVTRRLQRLHGAMQRFAAGEPIGDLTPRAGDEVSDIQTQFSAMASAVSREIADRQSAQQALRAVHDALESSEALLRQFIKHAPAAVAMFDTDMRYLHASERWLTDYRLEGPSILGRCHYDVFPDMPGHWKGVHDRVLAGSVERADEDRFERTDGAAEWLQWEVRPWRRADGVIGGVIMFTQVVTERKRAEQALQLSEEHSRTVATELVALNARYARHEAALTALTRSYVSNLDDLSSVLRHVTDVVARTLESRCSIWRFGGEGAALVCEDAVAGPPVRESAAPPAAEGAPTDAYSTLDVPIRAQGATVGVLRCEHGVWTRRWTPDEQTFAVAVANLVSALMAQAERQSLEVQLRQAQKMEAVGQLAGGVAHDFNNILTVILGKAVMIAQDDAVGPQIRDAGAEIVQNGERAANLTRQLLTFSRRQSLQARTVDLNAVVANVARMLLRILGEDVSVDFAYASRASYVHADPGMIDQVLLNLAVNARDAMPGGGNLSIETSIVEIDNYSARDRKARPGTFACVEVRDTGSGILPEHLPHIFEPFYTTKDVGKGTGLGLATSYGIVQQHDGWIEVASEVGRGSQFRVFLPLTAAPALETAPPKPILPPARGTETILVVEDEEAVRTLVTEALAGYGYRVLEAASGPQALDVWAAHGPTIDLLLTDMVMPDGLNGLELARRLRAAAPDVRIIYTSGYLADISSDDVLQTDGAMYLAKPFSLATLAQTIRTCLDRGTDRAA